MEAIEKHLILNACPEDYENINKFFHSSKTKYFGRHRKKDTLEELFFNNYKSHRLVIPITLAKLIIIGYAEVSNVPDLPALPGDSWLDFINFHYCCNLPLSVTNTCFLNKFVYHMDYNPEMLKQLLGEIFYRENKLQFILVLECPDYRRYSGKDVREYSCLLEFSSIFYPKCFSEINCAYTQKLHVIMRENILPQIKYRKALPEDNDDIVAIVNQDNPQLKEQLGEYYIAEELLSDSNSLITVAEINNQTSGFIWLEENIDIPYLLQSYNLQSFGNLLKLSGSQTFEEHVLNIDTAQRRPLDKLFTTEVVNQMYMCAGEVTALGNLSNLSLCSRQMINDEDRQKISLQSFLTRWEKINEKLKSSHYYIQIHKRQLTFSYNIPWESQSNAFVLEFFGLMAPCDPSAVFQFLVTAFTAFPNKDYCLLYFNSRKQTLPIILEILKYFIPVSLRPNSCVADQMFITHRGAIYGDVSLFAARIQDKEDIIKLLKQDTAQAHPFTKCGSDVQNRFSGNSMFLLESDSYDELTEKRYDFNLIVDILKNIFKDPFSHNKCFTIRCGDSTRSIDDNKIIGFIIIRPFISSNYLQKHFHMVKKSELQNFLKAEIVALKLHPLFHFQADLIFRELCRQTNYSFFYYLQAMYPNDLVGSMQPLEPRRIKKLWFNYLDESSKFLYQSFKTTKDGLDNKVVNALDLLNDNFAVYKTNLRPTAYFGTNKNIVIVGFTDVCKAFLRLMIFSWHNLSNDTQASLNCVPQLNITVICRPGVVEADYDQVFDCKSCSQRGETCWVNFKNSDAFIRDVCDRLNVRNWIKFVSGKIQTIDSDQNLIVLQSDCKIYYETLLLMCGTDFGIPRPLLKLSPRPFNYWHFNNRFDKILFYHKLHLLQKNLPANMKKSVIVYGCHLRALEFVTFLMQHGIKGSEICMVLPRSSNILQMHSKLNNSTEDKRIEEISIEMLEDSGVQVYELMHLSGYKLWDTDGNLKEVIFKKYIGNEEMVLECDLFISFFEWYLPRTLLKIFKAAKINTEQNFVLVNEDYQTSVKNIYAMGNFIKHDFEPNHQYRFVSPQEMAEKIINILKIFETVETIEKKFSKSCYFQAQLPQGYLLVKVTIPKRYLANHLDNEYVFPLVTYNDGEFSRVRLNLQGMVEEIVIVTKKQKDYDFLKFFCGHHESMLNNLKSRWYLKDIISFIDFFQEPWTELLMHDEFEKLRTINKNFITPAAQELVKKDIERDERLQLLHAQCQEMGITAEIENSFLEFLRNHREDFNTDILLPEDLARRSTAETRL